MGYWDVLWTGNTELYKWVPRIRGWSCSPWVSNRDTQALSGHTCRKMPKVLLCWQQLLLCWCPLYNSAVANISLKLPLLVVTFPLMAFMGRKKTRTLFQAKQVQNSPFQPTKSCLHLTISKPCDCTCVLPGLAVPFILKIRSLDSWSIFPWGSC